MEVRDLTLDVEQSIEVQGSIDKVFESVLYRLGEGNIGPNGETMNLKIEPVAGGRWFRDRGAGIQHLWGHVQVIKPPELLELSGPLFMSYPAINHIEVRLESAGNGTKVTLRHRAVGLLEESHRQGLADGWGKILDRVRNDFSQTTGTKA